MAFGAPKSVARHADASGPARRRQWPGAPPICAGAGAHACPHPSAALKRGGGRAAAARLRRPGLPAYRPEHIRHATPPHWGALGPVKRQANGQSFPLARGPRNANRKTQSPTPQASAQLRAKPRAPCGAWPVVVGLFPRCSPPRARGGAPGDAAARASEAGWVRALSAGIVRIVALMRGPHTPPRPRGARGALQRERMRVAPCVVCLLGPGNSRARQQPLLALPARCGAAFLRRSSVSLVQVSSAASSLVAASAACMCMFFLRVCHLFLRGSCRTFKGHVE